MADLTADVAVIGAGTAGLGAESAARKAGASTLLIDEAWPGTTCASVGCMPSKLLILAAETAHRVRQADVFGIGTGEVRVNGPAVMQRVRKLRDRFTEGTKESAYGKLPEGVAVTGRARFTGQTSLVLDDGRTIEARAVVIATGSAPMIPPPFRDLGDRVLTNRTVFEIEDLPRRLAVVGAGLIGLELAQAMARLGVEVCVFDRGGTVGSIRDGRVESVVRDFLSDELTLVLGVDVSAEAQEDGVRVSWSGDASGEGVFDAVLVATGRPPQLDALDLEAAGLELDDNGVPIFDDRTMQCGDAPVFICGDANAARPILHEASREGAIAGRNAVAYPAVRQHRREVRFELMFTDPPVATVGRIDGDDLVSAEADYTDQGRAKVENRAAGCARLFASRQDGRLAGAVLACPGAEHLSHLLLASIRSGQTVADLYTMPFYHPTLEEGLKGALREICRNLPEMPVDMQEQAPPPGG